jgi:hypothetical protein
MRYDVQDVIKGVLGQDLDDAFEETFPNDPTISALIAEETDGLEWCLFDCTITSVTIEFNVCYVEFDFILNGYRPESGPEREIGEQIGGHVTLVIRPDAWEFTDVMVALTEDEDDGEEEEGP